MVNSVAGLPPLGLFAALPLAPELSMSQKSGAGHEGLIPLLAKEGWPPIRKCCEASKAAQTGWSLTTKLFATPSLKHFGVSLFLLFSHANPIPALRHQHYWRLPEGCFLPIWIQHRHLTVVFTGRQLRQR